MSDEQLVVLLEARVTEFEKRMKRAEQTGTRSYRGLRRDSASATRAMERDMLRSTTRINQALASTSARIGTFARSFAGGFIAGGAIAGITGLVRGVRGATRGMAELGDEARRAGLSFQAFQELKFVAQQNRIGVDQMVDGLKELNLRADEFVVTGKGPAAEAFARLGFSAAQLKTELEKPDELMMKIIGRLGDLDKAAQIRIADEVFGGTAGERFVELIAQGEGALRATAERAHEVGAVLADDVIVRAQELDRRFQEIETRMGSMFKAAVVGIADFVTAYDSGINERLDQTLVKMETIERFDLGDITLEDAGAGLDVAAAEAEAEALAVAYDSLADRADGAAMALFDAAMQAGTSDFVDAGIALNTMGGELSDLIAAWRQNQISADTFRAGLEDVTTRAGETIAAIDGLNGLDMSGVIGELGGVTTALSGVVARAVQAATAVLAIPGTSGAAPVYGAVGARGDPPQFGKRPDPAIAIPPVVTPLAPPRPSGGGRGAGGGGGRSEVDAFREAMEGTRLDVRQLEAEAAALVVLAASGRDVGDALEFARKRAELMQAAQEGGKAVTPELAAEIDALAEAYARAGVAAEDAADHLQKVEQQAEAGAAKMADLFTGVLDGSVKAKDAIAGLLAELVKTRLMKNFTDIAKSDAGGGFFGTIGKFLGFSSGGYTGAGPADQVAGVVHGGEYVVKASEVQRPGVRALLERINSGVPGFADGGMVPGGAASAAAGAVSVNIEVINKVAGTQVREESAGPGMTRLVFESAVQSVMQSSTGRDIIRRTANSGNAR